MTQRTRILLAGLALVIVAGSILGLDALRRARSSPAAPPLGEPTLAAGAMPIYADGRLAAGFAPEDLQRLAKVSFVDAEEGKAQEGWLLRDVILLYVQRASLPAGSSVEVSSSGRSKSANLTWAEVDEPGNWVLLSLSNRGTLKLVSKLDRLDTRDEWVQDVDRIEIHRP